METVIINARLINNKKVEFFQTMESLKRLVRNFSKSMDIIVDEDNNLNIHIVFEDKEELERNFYNYEFNILKGSLKSLCVNTSIKVNNVVIDNS